jgi:hypothetical protein
VRHRKLRFANNGFTSPDGAKVSAERKDDNWLVSVDGQEFYFIPDALLYGG